MKTKLALLSLAVVSAVSLGGITTASAGPNAAPSAKVVGKVNFNKDGTATVKAHYICPDGDDWHLWVSAKQAADGSRNDLITAEGAGERQEPAAWLESHPTSFSCDGKWHTQKFRIDNTGQGYGDLIPGEAWVQFCLISEGFFVVDQRWAKVR